MDNLPPKVVERSALEGEYLVIHHGFVDIAIGFTR
jgi:hypothetical protein